MQNAKQHMHRCESCRSQFVNAATRSRFCNSCRYLMERKSEEIKMNLGRKGSNLRDIQDDLICEFCQRGEHGRRKPAATKYEAMLLADTWATYWVSHFMKHVFWSRFPEHPWFKPHLKPEDENLYQTLKEIDKEYENLSAREQIEQARKMRADLQAMVIGKNPGASAMHDSRPDEKSSL